jgi:hypothetical protein
MLNLEETLETSFKYSKQRDLLVRLIVSSLGVLFTVEYLRAQVPEINLIQLIPGFYLILVFCSLVLIVSLSDSFFRIPFQLDIKKDFGTKTVAKMELTVIVKFGILLLTSLFYVLISVILPLSLDSFDNYENNNLDNLWSFDEVLGVEIVLTYVVLILSQFPNLAIFNLSTERDINSLPNFWKDFSFLTFVVSGIITPTIDGYTQLSFAFSGISLYLVILLSSIKRLNQKFSGSISLNF